MTIALFARGAIAIAASILSTAALAQQPLAEVFGQPVQVTTNGITNTLYFDANGTVRIVTPNANVVQGTWTFSNGNLCIMTGAAQECWPYNAPFQAQQPQTLASSCSTSTWVAQATNPGPAVRSERGN
ncbi:MAG: hypothetical protein ACREBK_05860 [Sphingomicrobium sp.]